MQERRMAQIGGGKGHETYQIRHVTMHRSVGRKKETFSDFRQGIG